MTLSENPAFLRRTGPSLSIRLPGTCRLNPEEIELAFFAERLPWDSALFNYSVARLNMIVPLTAPHVRPRADYAKAVHCFVDEAARRSVKYLFAIVDARDLSVIRALNAAHFELIETRCTFHRDIRNYSYPRRFRVREPGPGEAQTVGRIARQAVNPYDRFHADPFITPGQADQMMQKWIDASLLTGFSDLVYVPDVADIKAVGTLRTHRENWQRWGLNLAQLTLVAVLPEAAGWYPKMLSESLYRLLEMGAEHAFLVTQITNTRMLRITQKMGFVLGKGSYVFRRIL